MYLFIKHFFSILNNLKDKAKYLYDESLSTNSRFHVNIIYTGDNKLFNMK